MEDRTPFPYASSIGPEEHRGGRGGALELVPTQNPADQPSGSRHASQPTAQPRTAALLEGRIPAALVGAACSVIQFAALVRGGFFLDDYANLARNKRLLSLDLLTTPIGTNHFQPMTQLIVWISAEPMHSNYPATVVLLAAITGLGAYGMVRLLDELFGTRLLQVVIGFLLGTSWILVSTNQWFAGSAAAASAACAVGACLAFARWLRSNRWRHYLSSLLATAAAIGFWESALAVPAILFALWVCFSFDRQSARRVIIGLAPFFVLALACVLYVEAQPWASTVVVPSLSQWAHLVWVMVVGGLLPSVVATGSPKAALTTSVVVSDVLVVSVLGFSALWLWTRRRLRWSSFVFLSVGVLLVSVPVATERQTSVAFFGIPSRYLTFLPMLLGIAVAGAILDRPRPAIGDYSHSVGTRQRPVWWIVGTLVGVGCMLYLVNLNATFRHDPASRLLGERASTISENIATSIQALPRSQNHSIVDDSMPYPIWYQAFWGYVPKNGEFDRLMPNWSATARTYGEGPHLVELDASGHLRPASFLQVDAQHPNAGTDLYERIVVKSAHPTTMRALIEGVRPFEPVAPWSIPVRPGTHSFVLPVWSSTLRSARVSGPGLHVVTLQTGTVVLEGPRAGESS